MEQKALIIHSIDGTVDGLGELNSYLKKGWHVVSATPLGGSSAPTSEPESLHLAALVVIERRKPRTIAAAPEAEEEVDEILEEISEGNGASATPDEPDPTLPPAAE